MPSISTLIGGRFEEIVQQLYPELKYVGDERNLVPDFEHDNFYLEAKVTLSDHAYSFHLKKYQVESFSELTVKKPVLYIVGFHGFENSMARLDGLSPERARKRLAKEMHVGRIILVDNATMVRLWQKRNHRNEKGNIEYCDVRESHLRLIIRDGRARGTELTAREYFGIPSQEYSFALPAFQQSKGLEIGHILPANQEHFLNYFYGR